MTRRFKIVPDMEKARRIDFLVVGPIQPTHGACVRAFLQRLISCHWAQFLTRMGHICEAC
jgi:hypothetical protein